MGSNAHLQPCLTPGMGVPPHCLNLRAGQTGFMAPSLAPPVRQAPPRADLPSSPHLDASAERVLVVGYDGSPGSRAAIAEAGRRCDHRERLIIVRALKAGFSPLTEADRSAYRRAVTSLLSAVRSELPTDVPYELRVVAGDISSALADVVRRHHGAALVNGDPAAGRRPNQPARALRARASAPAPAVEPRAQGQGEAPRADPVHRCGLESFPASDPPSWWGGSSGA
jgi:hypothetical protein